MKEIQGKKHKWKQIEDISNTLGEKMKFLSVIKANKRASETMLDTLISVIVETSMATIGSPLLHISQHISDYNAIIVSFKKHTQFEAVHMTYIVGVQRKPRIIMYSLHSFLPNM